MSIFSRQLERDVFDAPTAVTEDLTGDYALDTTHTRLGFSARHAMVTTVRGGFADFEGDAHIDLAHPAASHVELEINAASIDTGVPDRDAHLKSADFFDVENYPRISFRSTSVERTDETWAITGDLTIKGTTKPVTIDFEQTGSAKDPFGNTRVGFEGGAAISRKEWGLTWNAALETGGVLVSDKVKLEFDVSAVKKTSDLPA